MKLESFDSIKKEIKKVIKIFEQLVSFVPSSDGQVGNISDIYHNSWYRLYCYARDLVWMILLLP